MIRDQALEKIKNLISISGESIFDNGFAKGFVTACFDLDLITPQEFELYCSLIDAGKGWTL